jgi:hypothetical protein
MFSHQNHILDHTLLYILLGRLRKYNIKNLKLMMLNIMKMSYLTLITHSDIDVYELVTGYI